MAQTVQLLGTIVHKPRLIVLDEPATGVLGALQFPATGQNPPKWVSADAVSYLAVNWDLAKNVARHAVAAEGDPSVLDVDRHKVVDALRLARSCARRCSRRESSRRPRSR